MNALKKANQLVLLGLVLGLVGSYAQADSLFHPWKDERHTLEGVELAPSFSYYRSTSNYGSTGNLVTSTGFQNYTRSMLDVDAKFVLWTDWTIYGRLSFARVSTENTTAAKTGDKTGLADQTVGLNWFLLKSKSGIEANLQFQWEFPAYSITGAAPALGEGIHEGTAGAFLAIPIIEDSVRSLRLSGGSGFRYRTDDYSHGIPWSTGLQLNGLVSGLNLNAMVYGFHSLTTKTSALSTQNPCFGNLGNDSCAVGVRDPSLITLRVEAAYDISETFRFSAHYAKGLWGTNAPNGWQVGGGVSLQLWGKDKKNRFSKDPKADDKKEFVEYYPLEARVQRVNDRFQMIKIDKGKDDGVTLGESLDVFTVTTDGKPVEMIAHARVSSLKEKEAALTIVKYLKEVWIEEGFLVKRPVK